MCFTLALAYDLALASIVNYDHNWRYNVKRHLLMTLAASITIVIFYNTGHRSEEQTEPKKFTKKCSDILSMRHLAGMADGQGQIKS